MLEKYRKQDFMEVVRTYVEAFTAPPLSYDFLTKEKAGRYLRDITRAPGFLGFTYRINGAVAAFCLGTVDDYFDGSIYEIKEFAVAAAFHRTGIGSEVLAAVETEVAGHGVAAVSLQTSRTIPAFNFYQKSGYNELNANVTLIKWL